MNRFCIAFVGFVGRMRPKGVIRRLKDAARLPMSDNAAARLIRPTRCIPRSRFALVLLAAIVSPTHADDLGRLFFSAAERQALDAARATAALPVPPPPSVSTTDVQLLAESPTDIATPPVTVNGIVSRSVGPSSAWVNGENLETSRTSIPGSRDHPVSVRHGALEFTPDRQQRLRVKPGQTYDPIAARVLEAYDQAMPEQ